MHDEDVLERAEQRVHRRGCGQTDRLTDRQQAHGKPVDRGNGPSIALVGGSSRPRPPCMRGLRGWNVTSEGNVKLALEPLAYRQLQFVSVS